MKIALLHDYLREYGGAERVLEALHELYPAAPVFVSFKDEAALGSHWQRFADWDIRETRLTQLPFYKKLYSPYRVFAAWAFRGLDLSEYDVVISSSNAYFAKAATVPNGIHVCYCHTPPRSLYGYSTMSDWKKNPITRLVGTLINHYARVVDYNVAQHVDLFIANSEETQRRIQKFYRRSSVVVNPPVTVGKQMEKTEKQDYFLYVNRLALAKHPELAVEVCLRNNWPLKVVGTGKMLSQLQELAHGKVEFLGAVNDAELARLYAQARALLYPVEDEDFGIVPIEAMAHGTPVIAHKSGGPKETVLDGKTGLFFEDLSVKGLEKAVQQFIKQEQSFHPNVLHAHALSFSKERFQKEISKIVTGLADNTYAFPLR